MITQQKTTKLFSEKHEILNNQLMAIADYIVAKKGETTEIGLLGGTAGITLLFGYLARLFPEKNYTQVTMDYLDDLGNALANDALEHSMSSGVAGIAFVFQHLRNIGVLDIAEDLNLDELDDFIDKAIDADFKDGNWDPLHGMVGLGIYFLERNKETGEKKYLEKIVDYLASMRTALGNYQVWITPGYGKYSNDNYNFGMAHGMPGVLSFLALVYERGIRQKEINEMVGATIPYLLSNQYADEDIYCFPTSIDVKPLEEVPMKYSRLAWCYGDLCMANMLLHCGRILQNKEWMDKGEAIALITTSRTNEQSGCDDAPFCHGSVGIVHQYCRIYARTENEAFKAAAGKWLDITLNNFYKPDIYHGVYHARYMNMEKGEVEYPVWDGLLEGNAGIALVFLSIIYDLKPDWDIIFLTNV